MKQHLQTAKVGLMIIAGLVAIWGVYLLVNEQTSGGDSYRVWTLFEDAQGLVPKSRVMIAGIPVGYIEKISLSAPEDFKTLNLPTGTYARVDIQIDSNIPIYKDGKIAKRFTSLLGEAMLVIQPGNISAGPVEDGAALPVVEESVNTDEVINKVHEIAEHISKVTEQFEKAFGNDAAGARMEEAFDNLAEAIEAINRTIQQNEEVIGSTLHHLESLVRQGEPKAIETLDNLETTTGDLRDIIGNNKEGIDSAVGRVDGTVESIQQASERLEEVLTDIKQVTERTAQGKGTVGRLTSDDKLIDEIESVAEGLGDVVGGISRTQTIVGLRSEYNFLANTFKSYVSLRFQPREDRYYLFQLIDDPRGLRNVEQTTIRTTPPKADEPPFYQETRVSRSDALRFSLMLAKRIHFATFRFGLLESKGGIGVDFHVFDDRLEMNTDVFGIGEYALPRLRLRLSFEIIERLWILGGADDVLNEDPRDYFLGAMIRFNDEDLKSIFPFIGGAIPSGG